MNERKRILLIFPLFFKLLSPTNLPLFLEITITTDSSKDGLLVYDEAAKCDSFLVGPLLFHLDHASSSFQKVSQLPSFFWALLFFFFF